MIEFISFHKPISFVVGSFSDSIEAGKHGVKSIVKTADGFLVELEGDKSLLIPSSSVSFARIKNVKDKKVSSSKGAKQVKTKGSKKV